MYHYATFKNKFLWQCTGDNIMIKLVFPRAKVLQAVLKLQQKTETTEMRNWTDFSA